MLARLVAFSLARRGVVLVLAAALIAYGGYETQHASLDVFPDFVPPRATIQTEAPGISPEQIETLITTPIESAIQSVANIESVRSQSIQGLSIVQVIFEENTDIFRARQMLSERLQEIALQLPVGVKSPRLTPLTSATMDLLKIGLTSETLSPMQLRALADWELRPRLRAIPGVAAVHIYGGQVRQLQIQVRPDRLLALGLGIEDVAAAARGATGVRGAGFVETAAQRIVVQTEGQATTAEQLAGVVVTQSSGAPIFLRDVAEVKDGPAPAFGDALIQGRPGVLIPMLSQYGANTLEVTRSVEKALDELRPSLEASGVTLHPSLFRPASFIETAVANIRHSLLLGGALVAIVLMLFLWDLRSALISICAIPLSLLVAIIVLQRMGMTLNTITLGGLAMAIGEVVDDAIIDVENIVRRLRENRVLGRPKSDLRVILEASLEVRSAVVYATFVVVLVFVPVLTLSGLQGRLFSPLAVAYILAVLASLGVALTVTPALAYFLLAAPGGASEPRLAASFKRAYTRVLRALSAQALPAVCATVAICVAAIALLSRLGGEFLPEFREAHFVAHLNAIPGSSLAESRRLGQIFSKQLLEDTRVRTIPEQIGRAELGEDPWGPHRGESHINLDPTLSPQAQQNVQAEIRQALHDLPGTTSEVTTFLGDRIGETISGEISAVVVRIFGDDLDVLDATAAAVRDILTSTPRSADVQVKSPPGAPQMMVRLRLDQLAIFGLAPVPVLDAIRTAFGGLTVSQVYVGNRIFDVVVILPETQRADPEAVGNLLLHSAAGQYVALRDLADAYLTTSRSMLLHDGGRRVQTVTCNVEGRDLSSFVEEARGKVARRALPAGVYVEFGGEEEARRAAQHELLLHSAIAGLGILLLLRIVVGHWQNLLLILLNLPLALAGGVLSVYLTGQALSIGALVGFVTVFGITTRNSIMLISHYEHLVRVEGLAWAPETAWRGAAERLMPILMTALVTALGLLPIALGSGEAGREIEGPMAIAILGGLATSTLLNLLILPLLSVYLGRFEPAPNGGSRPRHERLPL